MKYEPHHVEAYPEFEPVNIRTVPEDQIYSFKGCAVWIHAGDFLFWIDGEEFTMPDGFYSDLNSDPAIIQLFLEKDNYHNIAAGGIHDWGYRTGIFGSRKRTDQVYRTVLEYYGSPEARLRYWGVRLGGWLVWRKHRKQNPLKG